MTLDHDIPNLALVGPGGLVIYRGGQPKNKSAWDYLRSLGVGRVIKLNTELGDEISGLDIHRFPITTPEQIWGPVGPQLEGAFDLLASIGPDKSGIFVHCEIGENRTGSLIILYRVRVCGWSLEMAIAEAKNFEWEWSLPALQVYVREHATGP